MKIITIIMLKKYEIIIMIKNITSRRKLNNNKKIMTKYLIKI